MPFSDLKPLTAKYAYQIWQKEWDETVLVWNKFHEIPPKLPDKLLSFCNARKENTVLNRLHIGHSYLTHSFILRKEKAPVCVACNAVITVKHILCWFVGDQKDLFRGEIFACTLSERDSGKKKNSCERLVCFTKYEVC